MIAGPGSDSGSTAMYDDQYDPILQAVVGEPMVSLIVLAVTTDDGRHGIMPYKYRPANALSCNTSVSPSADHRLVSQMTAVRCATEKAEGLGLYVA